MGPIFATFVGAGENRGATLDQMLKVELHTHTADDPQDDVPHSAIELIDRAATLGYDALAITLHDRQLDVRPCASYAKERGIVLLPGTERTIRGKHVLLINFRESVEQIQNFDELVAMKERSGGLVIAPHPYYPARCCLHAVLDEYPALFDAVEVNAFYTSTINFNRAAVRWATKRAKPLVGNGDVHHLRQLGPTYSLVKSEPDAGAICDAVAAGRVEVRTKPLAWSTCARILGPMLLGGVCRLVRTPRRAHHRAPARPGAVSTTS